MIRKLFAILFAGACLASTAALSQAVKVGSKNFTEQFIVGELYAQALEKAGIKVEKRLNLGSALIAHTALVNGDIDIYPEYTGTALSFIVKGEPSSDANAVLEMVRKHYEEKFKLTWLTPSAINNGYAIILKPELAEKLKLKTLTDLGPASGKLSFGAEAAFSDRNDGLPGLKKVYGIEFKEFLTFAKLGLRYSALLDKQIDVSFGFATDWQIAANKLVVLEDDKHLFPPYYLAPVIRQDTLAKNPQIAPVLAKVNSLLNNDNMREMNARVERDHEEPKDVAAQFLKSKGL